MIHYDPHLWWQHFFYVRGSMVREITGRVMACVVWTAAIAAVSLHVRPLGISSTAHSLAGVALSLMLVFRTNTSYARFWEGRTLWGGIVNESRNLARGARPFLAHAAPELYRSLVLWTAAFSRATASRLRNARKLGAAADALPREDVDRVEHAEHPALAVAHELSRLLNEGRERGFYSDYVQMQLDQNVQLLVDYLGGCERIHGTPLPFAYMVHLRRALALYCFTLPFALVDSLGWLTVAATFIVAYLFFGIEEIGVEIEDPFGVDDNDLPLDAICDTIQKNLMAMLPPEDAGERAREPA